jgi:UDP-N-acetylglucosamine 2-epimerase (non-hydrolysing)
MLQQTLQNFAIDPSVSLSLMRHDQSLAHLTSRLIRGLDAVFRETRPDLALVQGDTTTAFCASLAAFYNRIPVGHVEAGLRTGNLDAPWPEEANRILISRLAALHFAPTTRSVANLKQEGVSRDAIFLTGNTVIDALLFAAGEVDKVRPSVPGLPDELLDQRKRVVLITGHRRESFGEGFRRICEAIAILARRFPDVHFVYPVHLNPNVRRPVASILGSPAWWANIHLLEPVTYLPFVRLLKSSLFVMTDSGGIQEEAPSLGKPVLVMRDTTERPEAVEVGSARLIGTDTETIVENATTLLTRPEVLQDMACARNPFGDGQAAIRIVEKCREFLDIGSGTGAQIAEFQPSV